MASRLAVALVAVVLTGCGTQTAAPPTTSGEPTTAPSTTAQPAPAVSPTPSPRADAATVDLATKATITQADLGGVWTVYAPAKEPDPLAETDCAAGSPVAGLPSGARQSGAQLKYGAATWYVSTSSAVFADEATAKAWVEVRKSDTFVECRRAEHEVQQKALDPQLSVVTDRTTAPGLGTAGYEAYAQYQVKAGAQTANGSFARHTYRLGRTVIALSIDIAVSPGDPPNLETTVSDDVTRALTAVYGRIGG
jgi:hypothetical protein